jgi:hypothetical protein
MIYLLRSGIILLLMRRVADDTIATSTQSIKAPTSSLSMSSPNTRYALQVWPLPPYIANETRPLALNKTESLATERARWEDAMMQINRLRTCAVWAWREHELTGNVDPNHNCRYQFRIILFSVRSKSVWDEESLRQASRHYKLVESPIDVVAPRGLIIAKIYSPREELFSP